MAIKKKVNFTPCRPMNLSTKPPRSSVSEPLKSRSNSRRPSLSDEKDVLVLQVLKGFFQFVFISRLVC